MSQHMLTFTFGSQSMNTILTTPAAENIDATFLQHNGTLYILCLSMKMDVSTALQLILSKMVNPCPTTSSWIQETHLLLL
jgi:GH43 family beta-xylosidase